MKPVITDITGIGRVAASTLAEHGITTVLQLARAPLETIAAVPGFSEARAERVRAAAAELLGTAPEAEPPETAMPDSADAGRGKDNKDKNKGKGKGKKG